MSSLVFLFWVCLLFSVGDGFQVRSNSNRRLSCSKTFSLEMTRSFKMNRGGRENWSPLASDEINRVSDDGTAFIKNEFVDERESEQEDDPNLIQLVEHVVTAADSRKGEDIVVLRVYPLTTVTSYMVFVCGTSRPQNQAIVKAIIDDVEEANVGVESPHPQGTADSGWIVLDFGSVIVHIMTPRSRKMFNVDGYWRDERGALEVSIDHLLVPNAPNSEGVDSTMSGLSEGEDPFWS